MIYQYRTVQTFNEISGFIERAAITINIYITTQQPVQILN